MNGYEWFEWFFGNHEFHKLAECQWADHVEYCIQGVKAMSKITI